MAAIRAGSARRPQPRYAQGINGFLDNLSEFLAIILLRQLYGKLGFAR